MAAPARSAIQLDPVSVFALTTLAAAGLYFFRIGAASLGASEAYSAWAAAMPGITAIVKIPILLDPGKQIFYYIALHYFADIFGLSETSLRMFSAILAIATLAVLFTLARRMFSDSVAAAACVLWSFNPVIMILARRARMYPMFAVIALLHFTLLWQVRRRGDWPRTVLCGLLGALVIYTHLAGICFLGAEAAMLARDVLRGRRDKMAWSALAIAMLLYLPCYPIFAAQSRVFLSGHTLDYVGTGNHFGLIAKTLAALTAGATGIAIVFGPQIEDDAQEPLRWCVALAVLPFVAFLSGSIIVRPMFQIRYLIASVAMLALIAARILDGFGSKTRNLGVAAITAVLLVLVPVREITNEPWRDIATEVTARSAPGEPVFFESGPVSFGRSGLAPAGEFPRGYYHVPFDYYFRAGNPQVAVPGWDAATSREIVTEKVARAGGGWLVTWKDDDGARAEMPDAGSFRITQEVKHNLIGLYRIEPIAH